MEIYLFEAYGCQVIKRDDKIYVRYDSGGIGSRLIEKQITMEEAELLKKSEQDAYKVIINAQNRSDKL